MGAIQGAGRMRLPLLGDLAGFAILYGALAVAAQATAPESAAAPAAAVAPLYEALVFGMAAVAVVHLALVRWGGWVHGAARQIGSDAPA